MNILWNEKELSIQEVYIPKNAFQLHPKYIARKLSQKKILAPNPSWLS